MNDNDSDRMVMQSAEINLSSAVRYAKSLPIRRTSILKIQMLQMPILRMPICIMMIFKTEICGMTFVKGSGMLNFRYITDVLDLHFKVKLANYTFIYLYSLYSI